MRKVFFLKGTAQEYANLATKDSSTFYNTTDDNQLYLGEIKLSSAKDITDALTKIQTNADNIFALTGKIGNLEELTTTNKDDLVSAIEELKSSVETNQINGVVTITSDTTTEGAAKTYIIKQGSTTIGTIDIPKDMVVESGKVVKLTDGQVEGKPAGTYIELTLANATSDKLYINVGTLIDIYTAEADAQKVQIAIDPTTRKISASIVAKSIATGDIADNAITTDKIADGNITADKLSTALKTSIESAVQTVTTGTTNGTILVDGTAVSVFGLKSAAYQESTAFDEAGAATRALADAKTYVDGLLTWNSISGK